MANGERNPENSNDRELEAMLDVIRQKDAALSAEEKEYIGQLTEFEHLKRYIARTEELIQIREGELLLPENSGRKEEIRGMIARLENSLDRDQTTIESRRGIIETLQKEQKGIFDKNGEDYSLARETITWFAHVTNATNGWRKGGETIAEHLSATLPDLREEPGNRTNPVEDELLLQKMEESAMARLRNAYRQGIPPQLKQELIDILAVFERVGDDENLIAEAQEIANRLKE